MLVSQTLFLTLFLTYHTALILLLMLTLPTYFIYTLPYRTYTSSSESEGWQVLVYLTLFLLLTSHLSTAYPNTLTVLHTLDHLRSASAGIPQKT